MFLVPLVINTSYLIERVKDGFPNLEDSSTEYVITEVVGTMVVIVVKNFVDCSIRE